MNSAEKNQNKSMLSRLSDVRVKTEIFELEVPSLDPSIFFTEARNAYEYLGQYIKEFEDNLDPEQEIAAKLTSFGSSITLHIEKLGYCGKSIITFYGINDAGERVQLIQNIAQLNVLLIAAKKISEKPRRIGFVSEVRSEDGEKTPKQDKN